MIRIPWPLSILTKIVWICKEVWLNPHRGWEYFWHEAESQFRSENDITRERMKWFQLWINSIHLVFGLKHRWRYQDVLRGSISVRTSCGVFFVERGQKLEVSSRNGHDGLSRGYSLWDLGIVVSVGGTVSVSPGTQHTQVESESRFFVFLAFFHFLHVKWKNFGSLNYAKGDQWRRQWHPTRVLAWRIPWTKEPGGLQSMGSLGVGHDWATSLSLFTFMHWRRKRPPTPVFLSGESQGRGSLLGSRLWGRTESDMIEAT